MLQWLQLHSGGMSQASADAKIFEQAAEAKVLRAEEDASRLAASFMMKAALTKALHEEQASITQVSTFCNSETLVMSRHTTSHAPFVSCGSGSLKAIYSDIVLFVALLNKHHGLHNTPMANRSMSQKHRCKQAQTIAAT
jgi:hypothetical protein